MTADTFEGSFTQSARPDATQPPVIPRSDLDAALTAQLIVAWAGEGGEAPRLGWWRTDMVAEFGGQDLLSRMLPDTWRWAVLQSAREGARRHDHELRKQHHDPDNIASLFHFGYDIDEVIEDRLQDLKRADSEPLAALPGLADGVSDAWDRDRFLDWIAGHGRATATVVPSGRLLATMPDGLREQTRRLVAALAPLADRYPLPHFRRGL